eukprot:GGOE01058847.1.p1 GENE.GGOE01058847.1~~GGOE01058847.1.p1  ORF type:complete len:323 (+),score=67.35 GGOE01058847.1:121-1089(+)
MISSSLLLPILYLLLPGVPAGQSQKLLYFPAEGCPAGTWSVASLRHTCLCPHEMVCAAQTNRTGAAPCSSAVAEVRSMARNFSAFSTCRHCRCDFVPTPQYNVDLAHLHRIVLAMRAGDRVVDKCPFRPFLAPASPTYRWWPFTRRLLLSLLLVEYSIRRTRGNGAVLFLRDGTLLGAVRSGGFIVKDGDADCVVAFNGSSPEWHVQLANSVNRDAKRLGLQRVLAAKVRDRVERNGHRFRKVMLMSGKGPVDPPPGAKKAAYAFYMDVAGEEGTPPALCLCQLDGVPFYCPRDAEARLQQQYGKSWRTPKECKDVKTCDRR